MMAAVLGELAVRLGVAFLEALAVVIADKAAIREGVEPAMRDRVRPPVLRHNSIHLRFQQLRLSFSQPKFSRSKFDPSVERSFIILRISEANCKN